jgi:hypothetical protein
MGSGKDVVAALLAMVGYERLAFADQVRVEVAEAIKRGEDIAEMPADIKRCFDASTVASVWAKPTSNEMRVVLQWWGTEYRRSQDADYWVKSLRNYVFPGGKYAISDVRFDNEVALVRELGGHIWKINRDVEIGGIPGHISEQIVSRIVPDVAIENHGTMLELAEAVKAAL